MKESSDPNLTGDSKKLIKDLKMYFEDRIDLLRLDFIEKAVIITSRLFTLMVIIIFLPGILFFFFFGLGKYFAEVLQAEYAGYLLAGAIYLLIGIFLILLRKVLITDPLIRSLIKSVFNQLFVTKKKISDNENLSNN